MQTDRQLIVVIIIIIIVRHELGLDRPVSTYFAFFIFA